MPQVFKQALAEQDLVEIWLYTFNEWGEKQADKYLESCYLAKVDTLKILGIHGMTGFPQIVTFL